MTSLADPDRFDTYTIKVETPDGMMYVHILEQNEVPEKIIVQIGKCGTALSAWCDATSRLASRALPSVGLHGVIEELSGITSQGFRRLARGEVIRSGPEGVCYALLKYKQEKFKGEQPKRKSGRATVE